ncbi:MAG: hypothetical protein KIS86_19175, partial [Devosia sp.]|nr:hypothetical protein [Devosia sp.]
PIAIARMTWPSAALLAQIHARLLAAEFGCDVRVIPGDMAATTSSMGSTGQPAVAPEMWVTRIADVWNGAIQTQMVRSAAPTFVETSFEGWFMPDYVAGASGARSAAGLAAILPGLGGGTKPRFISCPADWACALINANLLRAHGITDLVDLVEPANRFEMDRLIAEAVNRREAFLFYYWQPNAVLDQLDFVALDMGPYDEEAAKCLARLACATPRPSAFPSELVVVALSDWLFSDAPAIAGYFQRSSLPLAQMNRLLAQLNEPGATIETVAERFVLERADIWRSWVGAAP